MRAQGPSAGAVRNAVVSQKARLYNVAGNVRPIATPKSQTALTMAAAKYAAQRVNLEPMFVATHSRSQSAWLPVPHRVKNRAPSMMTAGATKGKMLGSLK